MNIELWIILVLFPINLAAGAVVAIPLMKNLQQIRPMDGKSLRRFFIFVGLYLAECIAFPIGMCFQVFTIALSFVWGAVLGLRLRKITEPNRITRLASYVALYGSIPTASFCIFITVFKIIEGGNVLSGTEGVAFGMPDFLPWPFNSILGFFAALMVGTVILKLLVSYITVNYITRRLN